MSSSLAIGIGIFVAALLCWLLIFLGGLISRYALTSYEVDEVILSVEDDARKAGL